MVTISIFPTLYGIFLLLKVLAVLGILIAAFLILRKLFQALAAWIGPFIDLIKSQYEQLKEKIAMALRMASDLWETVQSVFSATISLLQETLSVVKTTQEHLTYLNDRLIKVAEATAEANTQLTHVQEKIANMDTAISTAQSALQSIPQLSQRVTQFTTGDINIPSFDLPISPNFNAGDVDWDRKSVMGVKVVVGIDYDPPSLSMSNTSIQVPAPPVPSVPGLQQVNSVFNEAQTVFDSVTNSSEKIFALVPLLKDVESALLEAGQLAGRAQKELEKMEVAINDLVSTWNGIIDQIMNAIPLISNARGAMETLVKSVESAVSFIKALPNNFQKTLVKLKAQWERYRPMLVGVGIAIAVWIAAVYVEWSVANVVEGLRLLR